MNPESELWDVVVVGTGMGGATAGWSLARQGKKVLFLEQGASREEQSTRGNYPEDLQDFTRLSSRQQMESLVRGGRSIDEVEDHSVKKVARFTPYIGGGAGGSSALYGMVLERLFESDFTPRQCHSDLGDSTLPEQWPITYEQIRPWYTQAESLYRVHGQPDPLRPGDIDCRLIPSPPLVPANAELAEHFQSRGLHPYQVHLGCEYLPECQTCQGYLCSTRCKSDASNVCLSPAVAEFGASLLSRCRVLRLEATPTSVRRALCRWNDREIAIQGKVFILAAGALVSPMLLQQSKSVDWPNGLANRNDQVGRNLMRHAIDLVMVTPKKASSQPIVGQIKELALSDFYQTAEGKFGSLQSFGPLPSADVFAHSLNLGSFVERLTRKMFRPIWRKYISQSLVLAAVMEDLPYSSNRVTPTAVGVDADDRQRLRLHYQMQPTETRRLEKFRRLTADALKPYKATLLRGAHDNKGIAHVCGTCRFGEDPQTSVLDVGNRAHDVDNLYVVDASFFPSSGGLNPSLTIAANALRVADLLADRL